MCLSTRINANVTSDLLTELDGLPCTDITGLLNQRLSGHHGSSIESLTTTRDSQDHTPQGASIENHVWLRSHINKVLTLLYNTDKAYAQPDELVGPVKSLSADLDRWYRDQPLDQQFIRDVTIFNMHSPEVSFRLVRTPAEIRPRCFH